MTLRQALKEEHSEMSDGQYEWLAKYHSSH